MKKILILASNPRKDLNVDIEIRDLKKVIESSRQREDFTVVDELAVRVGDLQELMLKHRPQIVHFCGHGGGEKGLVFESDVGKEHLVRTEALSNLFRLFSSNVECVLLNACYSEEQADAIVTHINYVIGMNQEIRDDAAIAFAKGFYRALGYACTIEESYDLGCNAIQLEISGSSVVRSAGSEAQRKLEVIDALTNTLIPEHLKPILKKRSTLILEASPNPLSRETKVEIQLGIDKSLAKEEDSKVKQYREQVKEYLSDRQLEDFEKDLLNVLRDELGLSPEQAEQILEEELAPISQAKQAYAARLNTLIKYYPFNDAIKSELKKFQAQRNLTDEEVDEISRPILEQAEYRQKLAEAQRQREQEEEKARERSRQREEAQRKREQEEAAKPKQQHLLQKVEIQTVTITGIEKAGFLGMGQPKVLTQRSVKQVEVFKEDLGKGVSLDMVRISGGTFQMGSPAGQGWDYERPQHSVTVPSFLMGKYPITQAQWRAVAALPQVEIPLDSDPSYFKGDDRPVEQVSWDEAVEFCQRLSSLTEHQYRLPSEAEWEYACRAISGSPPFEGGVRGGSTPFYFGETITGELANYRATEIYAGEPKGEYRQQTTPVGQFPPNAFGLYDMHGNVWEWCADHWHENYAKAPTDGSAWITGGNSEYRVLRGGSWNNNPAYCLTVRLF